MVKEMESKDGITEETIEPECIEGTAKELKENGSFLDKLDEHDGSKYHIKPSDGKTKFLLANWRWVENDAFAEKKEALVFDVLNINGEATEPYIDEKDNKSKFPDLTTTSARLIKALSPFLRDAEEVGKKEIQVIVEKFPGPLPTDTKYTADSW